MIKIAGVLTAAGASKRMGNKLKKEYLDLEGCPVLARATQPFLKLEGLVRIVVTVPAGHIRRARKLLEPYLDFKDLELVEGGAARQESVRLGLETLEEESPDYVLIHDGARPWVSLKLIERVLSGLRRYGACIPVSEITEAPKMIGSSGLILANLDRRQTVIAQTPQGFDYARILAAHRQARAGGAPFIDDAEIYSSYIGPVFTVRGESKNRKITYNTDLGL
ncbi:2-C-methyl-D-erythritol 4-phosphate cytidylyltransferase [subsurface metagenome]